VKSDMLINENGWG